MQTFTGKPSAVISAQDLRGNKNGLILLDCRPLGDYDFCHLDGAIHVDIESMLSSAAEPGHDPARGGRNPLPSPKAWERLLSRLGISRSSSVVAYDAASAAEGAARAWWMLSASGVKAAVLDGGWEAAVRARLPISESVAPNGPTSFEFTGWQLPTVDIEYIDGVRSDPSWILLDSRAPERWRGETEHMDPIAGRIPGSKNICFRENLENGLFKKPEDLRNLYQELLGGIPPTRVVASCGSGMTACHTLLAMYQAGLEGASVYIGSYSEWCRNRPTEVAACKTRGFASRSNCC